MGKGHARNEDVYLNKGGANEIAVADIVKSTLLARFEYYSTFVKPKTGVAVPTVAGLDDLTSDAILAWEEGYTGEANAIFDIKISTEGTPDKYQYRKDGGDWSTEKDITGYSNFLTGGTPSASSQASESYSAAKAVDGDTFTRWRSAFSFTFPEWWKYDLGEGVTKVIKRINLKIGARFFGLPAKDTGWVTFKIQGSNDDSAWDDLTAEITMEKPGILLDITNTTAYRYYRVYIIDCFYLEPSDGSKISILAQIREVEMYEESVGSDYIHLGEQVFVKFAANTGHTAEDYWTINCQGWTTTNDGSSPDGALNSINNAMYDNPLFLYPQLGYLGIGILQGNYLEDVGSWYYSPNIIGNIILDGSDNTIYGYAIANGVITNANPQTVLTVNSIKTFVMVQLGSGIYSNGTIINVNYCTLGAISGLSVSYGLFVTGGGKINSVSNIPDPVNPCTNDAMAANGGIIIQDGDSTLVLDYSAGGFVTTGANIVGADYADAIATKHDGTIQPNISSGTAAPSSTPTKIGDVYIDTNNKKLYFATGTSSSADWTIANIG